MGSDESQIIIERQNNPKQTNKKKKKKKKKKDLGVTIYKELKLRDHIIQKVKWQIETWDKCSEPSLLWRKICS